VAAVVDAFDDANDDTIVIVCTLLAAEAIKRMDPSQHDGARMYVRMFIDHVIADEEVQP
jgi:hypothetical protein